MNVDPRLVALQEEIEALLTNLPVRLRRDAAAAVVLKRVQIFEILRRHAQAPQPFAWPDPPEGGCPNHNPIQHRDMKPAWCHACGRP